MDKTKRGVRMNEMRNARRKLEQRDAENMVLMMVASVVQVAIIVMMNTHLYSFNGKIYQQTSGGPIGLRAACACARVVMNSWDIACMRKMEMNNVVVNLGMRYMDDIRLFLGSMEVA